MTLRLLMSPFMVSVSIISNKFKIRSRIIVQFTQPLTQPLFLTKKKYYILLITGNIRIYTNVMSHLLPFCLYRFGVVFLLTMSSKFHRCCFLYRIKQQLQRIWSVHELILLIMINAIFSIQLVSMNITRASWETKFMNFSERIWKNFYSGRIYSYTFSPFQNFQIIPSRLECYRY